MESDLLRIIPITDEPAEASCLAVKHGYDSVLREICIILGWQGGTRQQVLDEVKRIKSIAAQIQVKCPAQQTQPEVCPRCNGTKKVPGPFGGPAIFTCVNCDASVKLRDGA
jgi:hypothetical protein